MYTSLSDIQEQILFELGYPVLRVELLPDQIKYAIRKQMRLYQVYIPYRKSQMIEITENGTTSFQIRDNENRNILGLGLILTQQMTPSYNILYPVMYSQYGRNNLYTVADSLKLKIITQQTYELVVEDFLKRRYSFRFDPNTNTITAMPPLQSGKVFVEYYTDYIDIKEIQRSGQDWVFRYSLQLCKQMLGRLRSKYSGLSTQFGTIETDGQNLLQEQQTQLEQLENELKNTQELLLDIQIIG